MDRAKRRLVQLWVDNAREDIQLAQEILVNRRPYLRAAIYHCQQGGEKILKAFLVLHDQEPGTTHNVGTLVERVVAINPELGSSLDEADYLSQYNRTYRYPGGPTEDPVPSAGELRKAFRIARDIYNTVIAAMPPEITGQ